MTKVERCSVLDSNGRQCNGVAVVKYGYHGNPELSSREHHGWVAVFFCAKHYDLWPFKGISRMRLANRKEKRNGKG